MRLRNLAIAVMGALSLGAVMAAADTPVVHGKVHLAHHQTPTQEGTTGESKSEEV